MNNLEEKIKEITDKILEYTKEIDGLKERDEELIIERDYYDEKLSKINKLREFHFEESKFDLLKKVNFYKYLSKTLLGISGISVIGSIYSFIMFISFFNNPILSTISFGSSIAILITSLIGVIESTFAIKKIDKKHNSLCDAYYLNEELLGNEVYDFYKLLDLEYDYRVQRDSGIIETVDNEKKRKEYRECIQKLRLLLQELNTYKDSLDGFINKFIEINMPSELKEKMNTPFVKVKK